MSFDVIEKLRQATPGQRAEIMQATYEKNLDFFRERHPLVLQHIRQHPCPYRIDMTETFLNIVHEESGELAHPAAGLDYFAEMMGDWIHNAWIDLFNFRVVTPEQYPRHSRPVAQLHEELVSAFPEYPARFAQRRINLKELEDGRRFSPPVIFLGIFHGLHIAHFLSRTQVAFMLFVEPDAARFEVSCYFLDYRAIREEFGSFLLSIGEDSHTFPIQSFFSNFHVTRHMWVRVLPAYEYSRNPYMVESFKMYQTSLASVFFPIDWEIFGLEHAVANLKARLPLLSRRPYLSARARIAVVATGPSLDNDLQWLQQNRSRLIIFAVHSAVEPLRKHGIVPDFQFSLESVADEDEVAKVGLHPDVPLITYYKAPRAYIDAVEEPLLCGTHDKAAPVRFTLPLEQVAPSTTNLAFSFACLCRPREIYLLGCDFGYLSLDKDHAAGSMYKTGDGEGTDQAETYSRDMSQVLVEANFPERKLVQSTPFFTHARLAVEAALREFGQNIKVFNLSDGARVQGTRPRRSSDVRLSPYKTRNKDRKRIRRAFLPAEKGINWNPYRQSGEEIVAAMKEQLVSGLRLESFDWCRFSTVLDRTLQDILVEKKEGEDDRRLDMFVRFLVDLLSTWYATVIFFDDPEVAAQAYRHGLDHLTAIIRDLEWPVEELT